MTAGSGESLSYYELDRRSNRRAHFLRQQGVQPGDAIAIVLPDQLDLLALVWATQRSGFTFTDHTSEGGTFAMAHPVRFGGAAPIEVVRAPKLGEHGA